jgi:hypothetical protein
MKIKKLMRIYDPIKDFEDQILGKKTAKEIMTDLMGQHI